MSQALNYMTFPVEMDLNLNITCKIVSEYINLFTHQVWLFPEQGLIL